MWVDAGFPGGNGVVLSVDGDTVAVERELRDTQGDWFYWAFRVRGCGGRTVRFRFPSEQRVGYFGPAVSRDRKHWEWLGVRDSGNGFTYGFAPGEDEVYFAHNMIYSAGMFADFCAEKGLAPERLCASRSGQDVPCVRIGGGERVILLTARHHACESTGNYVLEGALDGFLQKIPEGFSVIAVPFVDYDGVMAGDQGKNRAPHDHNRDYPIGGEASIYPETAAIRALLDSGRVEYLFDYHSPWHLGGRNDRVFLVQKGDPKPLRAFGELLAAAAAAEPGAMSYDPADDIAPGEDWNSADPDFPSATNYGGKQASMRLSVSLETAYFGTEENRFSQEGGRRLGRALAAALRVWIGTNL